MPRTPSQTIGPFFAPALGPGRTDLTGGGKGGEAIAIAGRVLDGDGQPVPDAMLEIWQADAQGRYGGDGFSGFGRALTGAHGDYRFTTFKPGRVPGPGGALQAPHVCLTDLCPRTAPAIEHADLFRRGRGQRYRSGPRLHLRRVRAPDPAGARRGWSLRARTGST